MLCMKQDSAREKTESSQLRDGRNPAPETVVVPSPCRQKSPWNEWGTPDAESHFEEWIEWRSP